MLYKDRMICGPMVRVSSLPFRLLALEYGADLVFSEELIDHRLIQSVRVENELLKTIDFFVPGEDRPILQIDKEREANRLIVQLGTCDGERALKAARIVENDVAGIDINMGCPKKFSLQGGMGAALLDHPEKIKQILETLTKNLKIPVSCKIRCLPSLEATLSLVRTISKTGVHAITVHGRTRDERNCDSCRENFIVSIVKENLGNVSIVANGGSMKISNFEQIEKFRSSCGPADGVMICQAAMWNPSVFRRESTLPIDQSLQFDNCLPNLKYVLQRMYGADPISEKIVSTNNVAEIYELFGMKEAYENSQVEQQAIWREKIQLRFVENGSEHFSSANLIEKAAKFIRSDFTSLTPKSILTSLAVQSNLERPIYQTEELKPQRIYRTILEFNGQRYTTTSWEKSKQLAEQGSAIVCLESLGIDLNRAKYGVKNMKICLTSNGKST